MALAGARPYRGGQRQLLGCTTTHTYDYLNRLTSSVATPSQAGGPAYNLTFSYDHYANMTCVTNGSTNSPCQKGSRQ